MSEIEYKGIGIRLLAQLVDWIVLSIIYALIWEVTRPESGGMIFIISSLIVTFCFLYFLLLEGLFGATLGKKLIGIKVIMEDGSNCEYSAAFVRNVLRFIDFLPFFYIIGMVLIARSEKKQRLGDRIAKTVIIGAKQDFNLQPGRQSNLWRVLENLFRY